MAPGEGLMIIVLGEGKTLIWLPLADFFFNFCHFYSCTEKSFPQSSFI